MREKLERIRELLDEVLESLGAVGEPTPPQEPPQAVKPLSDGFSHSPDWELVLSLLESPQWPDAVFAVQITDENSESDKQDRAEGIADILLPPLKGKKFLDFGCGEGHVARYVSKEAAVSVGYDPTRSPKSQLPWEHPEGGFLLTTDIHKVRELGPYDTILVYDVIDHTVGENPADMLRMAAEMMSEEGRMFVRCHPWCGRHGGHLYRKINKAFAHLVLTEEELRHLGIEIEYNAKVLKPLQFYSDAIKASGLKQDSEPEIDSQEVEDFFRDTPVVRDRILRNWGASTWGSDPPSFQMAQCFVDYVLKKK